MLKALLSIGVLLACVGVTFGQCAVPAADASPALAPALTVEQSAGLPMFVVRDHVAAVQPVRRLGRAVFAWTPLRNIRDRVVARRSARVERRQVRSGSCCH